MSIEIIKERQRITETTYDIVFERIDRQGGFSFPCNKDGRLKPFKNPAIRENYRKCKSGEYDVIPMGIRPYTHSWIEPAIAKCICGHKIYLTSFTNTCEKCGRDYNMCGQSLASRSQWGEETGETADEILNIGHTIS